MIPANMSTRSSSADHPAIVTDRDALAALVDRLKRKQRIALDTEAASFHRYVDRVYLVQVSSDDETALIDPLALDDLSPLGDLLADPKLETIFHDADYDLRILHRDYGFSARHVWDTRIAAQFVDEPGIGLGPLLERHFGITLSKKLQRADWSRRPLTPAMIAYAAADTTHLPALRDHLERELRTRKRLHWAEEEFGRLEAVQWTPPSETQQFLRLKGAKALPGPDLAIVRSIWEWRERTAAAMDRAPFRILANQLIVATARAAPTKPGALRRVDGFPESVAKRHGREIVAAVREGKATPEKDWPQVERRRRAKSDPATDRRYQRLRELRATRSGETGLEPGLMCPNGTLLAIARVGPTGVADLDSISELRRWQREVLSDAAILQAAGGGKD